MKNEVFILDSNIWISYVITRKLDKLVSLIHRHQLIVLTCLPLIQELQEVLMRPKFKKYLGKSDLREIIAIHLKICRIVDIDDTPMQLSDPKDYFLLNLYNKGEASQLVSGDKELIREAGELNYGTMTLREFELTYLV
jgi:putative PIN family toxin of toxin-antitoxin system